MNVERIRESKNYHLDCLGVSVNSNDKDADAVRDCMRELNLLSETAGQNDAWGFMLKFQAAVINNQFSSAEELLKHWGDIPVRSEEQTPGQRLSSLFGWSDNGSSASRIARLAKVANSLLKGPQGSSIERFSRRLLGEYQCMLVTMPVFDENRGKK